MFVEIKACGRLLCVRDVGVCLCGEDDGFVRWELGNRVARRWKGFMDAFLDLTLLVLIVLLCTLVSSGA